MNPSVDEITKTSAHLSLVEVVLGSVVHGLKIPFGGHSLSLNQGFFLLRHVQKMKMNSLSNNEIRFVDVYKAPIEISSIAAILKSLSPAGNKIGPMLSISMQGFLFSVGLLIGSTSTLGQLIGILLLSLWAFIQPFITLYIIHGAQLNILINYYSKKIQDEYPQAWVSIGYLIIILISIKMFLAILVFLSTYFIDQKKLDSFEKNLIKKAISLNQNKTISPTSTMTTFRKILHDLTKPLFLISMLLLIVFLFLTETDYAKMFWLFLRPLAIAILFFYFIRSQKIHTWLASISTKNKKFKIIYDKAQMTKKYIDELSKNLT